MKKTALLLAMLMLFGALMGCSDNTGGTGDTTAPTTAGDTTPTTGGDTTPTGGSTVDNSQRELRMTMMSGTDISTLDPIKCIGSTSWLLVNSLYDVPWVMDVNFNPVYRAATACDISEDGLVYNITIREGVKFHNGETMTAEDFAYSCEMAKEGPIFTAWSKYFDVIEVVDEKTVRITLSQPYAPMMNSMSDMSILPKQAHMDAGQDFGYSPIGSGPYQLDRYDVGDSITITAFEDFYLEPASIKKVSYKLIPEKSTVSIALETGELDFSSDFSRTDLDKLTGLSHLQLMTKPVQGFQYVTYNLTIEPFDNPLFRQAINYAVDRNAMIQMGGEGFGTPGNCVVNSLVFGYTETPGWDYNPEKAKELLAEAGYPNGEGVPEHTLYCYGSTSPKLAQIFQQNLRDIGIDWPIEEADMNLVWEYQESGVAAISFDGMGLGKDAAGYAQMLYTDGGFNTAFYSKPEVDELFDQGASVSDPEKRLEYYRQLWDIYQEDAPYMVLYYNTAVILCNADLDLSRADIYGIYGSSNILPYYLSWK